MNSNERFLTTPRKGISESLDQICAWAGTNPTAYAKSLYALRMSGPVGNLLGAKDASSTGQIFVQSELNKPDVRLHMPLEGHTWFRDVPLMNGGGWVDTETAQFVDVFSPNNVASPNTTGTSSNNIRTLNFNRSQDVYPTFAYQVNIRIPLIESLKLAQANKSPNDILDKGVRTDWNKTLDNRVYWGEQANQGLLNQILPGVVNQVAANGATSASPLWSGKTPLDIVNDFQVAPYTVWAASGYALDAVPDRFLVPASRWQYLLQPMTLPTTGASGGAATTVPAFANVLEYIKANYWGISINGTTPEIIPLPYWAENIGGAAHTGSTQLTCYKFDDDFVNFGILQDIQRMGGPLSLQDGAFVATYIANTGIVKLYRPTTIMYQWGI
jgi:hypothetical protein